MTTSSRIRIVALVLAALLAGYCATDPFRVVDPDTSDSVEAAP